MKRYFAVIDTNILVSAMFKKPSSVPSEIIKLVGEGVIVPLISQEIISEYRQVLLRPKFSFPENAVDDLLDAFQEVGELIDNAEDTTISLIDPLRSAIPQLRHERLHFQFLYS